MAVPERISWAVGQVGPRPGLRVLEIGYGPGHAVDLLCSAGAVVTGIDRSATAWRTATARNARHVEAGVADLRIGTVAELGTAAGFDAVLAVNVNLFWTGDAAAEMTALRAALAPGGALRLCYQPPSAERAAEIASRVAAVLTGYDVRTTTSGKLLCVSGISPGRARP